MWPLLNIPSLRKTLRVCGFSVARVSAGLLLPIRVIFVPRAEGNSKLYQLVLSVSPLLQEEQNSSVSMCHLSTVALPRHFCRDTSLLTIL